MELCRNSKAVPRIFLSSVAWTVVSAGDDKPQLNVTCMPENGGKQFHMKTFISPALIAVLAIGLPLARLTGHASTETAGSSEGFYAPETIEWKPGPPSLPTGAKMAVLEGDPTKEGPFVMRLEAPAGYHIAPHTHPKTERVTVISGTMLLAMGDNLDRSAAKTLNAGTYAFWPAGMKHTAWFDGPTVIQLHGIGPWQINYVNPADDPRNAKK
jgi:quercetin dioxygenase-like cupin family protein